MKVKKDKKPAKRALAENGEENTEKSVKPPKVKKAKSSEAPAEKNEVVATKKFGAAKPAKSASLAENGEENAEQSAKPPKVKKAKSSEAPAEKNEVVATKKSGAAKPEKSAAKQEKFATKKEKSAAKPEKTAAASSTPKTPLDTSIFAHFKELTSDEEQKRMAAALQLLQQLCKTKDAEKRQRELGYTLKRLIRGCGAATNASRAGFFTGLVAFLKAFDADEVTMEQIFETLQKELHVGVTIANKEDADAVVGKILTCGALLHAGRIAAVDQEHLEQITNILLQATRQRTYHASLGYSFLVELLEKITQQQFESSVWPLLHKELTKPWPKQTLQTVHCLIAAHNKFPAILNAKYLKTNFGGTNLLNDESYTQLHKIFWEPSNTDIIAHPAFELFGAHIARSPNLSVFWTETVDAALQTPSKLVQFKTLKVATDILCHLNTEQTQVADLLSPNFVKMLVECLRSLKQNKDETLKAFTAEFLEDLVACCAKLTQDAPKVAVIRRLLLPPGAFNIEKFTSTRVIHQLINALGAQGVQEIFELYKSVFLATLAKNPENSAENWLNFERLNAGYMLQHLLAHKSVQQAFDWRAEQLRFFLTVGVFHVSEAAQPCKKEAAGELSKDFGEQCRNMFFSSLQSKLGDLAQEKRLLFDLVSYCDERLQQKHASKYFKIKNFDDAKVQQAWREMYDAVVTSAPEVNEKAKTKKQKVEKVEPKEDDKLQLVFHILLLHMGLQLLREPEMAAPAIKELIECMERTQQKSKKAKKSSTGEEKPEWIEIVVELFLHLLSQNTSALRNIVNALFPHLCGSLNLSAVYQILPMLDMKDGQNPLSAKGAASDDEDDDDEEQEQSEDEVEEKDASDAEEEDDDEEDNDDDDDDEEEDDEEDDDGEEVTASDKLRNAISLALIENGGTSTGAVDDDMDSIDLNDMTEEEGLKLDAALANAFKALKKTTGTGTPNKKSKQHRAQTTTVMHFRIRVLDLIEIYLAQKPTLYFSIEIMLALFGMLEHCVGEALRPLQAKVEKVLNKLTALKTYPAADADLTEAKFVDFLRLIVEQKQKPASGYDLTNRLRNKCIVFLISHASKLAETATATATKTTTKKRGDAADGAADANTVLGLCQGYLAEFVRSRNPTVNITLLSDIFKQRWSGVWPLALALTQQGVTAQTRPFRRLQVFEILTVLYKNHELQKVDVAVTRKELKKIEKVLHAHIAQAAAAADDGAAAKHSSPKEFQTLCDLLLQAQRVNARCQLQSPLCESPETGAAVQTLRRRIRLESAAQQVYQRFCAAFKLSAIRNHEVEKPTNGHDAAAPEPSDDDEEKPETPQEVNGQAQKRKNSSEKNTRKQKKQKKQQRMLAASKGINGDFAFVQSSAQADGEGAEDSDDA